MPPLPTFTGFAPAVEPDVGQALAYFRALFPPGAVLNFRSVPEPRDSRAPQNHHYALDSSFPKTLADFLSFCNVESRAAYVMPSIVCPGGTEKGDVTAVPVILADFDKGDPAANLAAVEALLGPATLVAESGGMTECGPKLHSYWKLAEPATGAAIDEACRVREEISKRFGADHVFKQPAQVVRIPGSVHFKNGAKLVRLRAVRETMVGLPAASQAFGLSRASDTEKSDYFNFNNVTPLYENTVDRVMTQPVRSEGKDELTRFEAVGSAIGHFVRQMREGRMSEDAAWEATKCWNVATLQPPWPEDRLRGDFERLKRIDVETRGPMEPSRSFFVPTPAAEWRVDAWRADRYIGDPPARVWLVDGLLPAGTAGVFAAAGDAGKSMLALNLALVVSSYPAPSNSILGFNDTPRFFGAPIIGRGAAVILTSEDDEAEVHRRLHVLDPSNIRAGKPFYVVPMIAAGGPRAILADGPQGPQPTPFWDELRNQLAAIPSLKLIVFDPLSSFVTADINKDNIAGAMLMGMLGELAAKTGATITMTHHFNKGTAPTGLIDARAAIRGAGALVDNGRWALALWEADQDERYAVLKALGQLSRARQTGIVYQGGLAKSNAPATKTLRTLVRDAKTGLLEDVTEALRAAAPRDDELDDAVFKILVAYRAKHPGWSFPVSSKSLEAKVLPYLKLAGLDIGREKLGAVVGRLIANGLVVETQKPGQYEPNEG